MAGRPIQCDRGGVAERATARFWRSGFGGATVEDLVAETGVNRSCLYGEFGGKKGLFLRVCESYSKSAREELLAPLLAAEDPEAGLRLFFAEVAGRLTDASKPCGCLMADALREEDPEIRAAARRHFEILESAFAEVLSRVRPGASGPAQGHLGAFLLVTTLLGLGQAARLGARAPELRRTAGLAVDAALREARAPLEIRRNAEGGSALGKTPEPPLNFASPQNSQTITDTRQP